MLPLDNLYRHIGDTLYTEIHAFYAEELTNMPILASLTPIVLALKELERLTTGAAANYVGGHLGSLSRTLK